MNARLPFARLAIVLAYLTSLLTFSSQVSAQAAPDALASAPASVLAADPATVYFMRDLLGSGQIAPGDAWLIGGGYLYWAQCVVPGPNRAAPADQARPNAGQIGYLRRWPIRGGAIATLSSEAFCNTASWAADDSGLYYWQAGFIYRRSLASALTPVAVVDTGVYGLTSALVIDGAYLFYSLGNDYIYRTPKAQVNVPDDPRYDETITVVEGGAGANGLIVNGGALNWFGGGRVRSAAKTCVYPDPCAVNELAIEPGAYLSNASIASPLFSVTTNPLWVAGPLETITGQTYAGNTIRAYSCRFTNIGRQCNAGNEYTAPNRPDGAGTQRPSAIGPLASDGNYLFWVENLKVCNTGSLGTTCRESDQGRLMKYHIGRAPLGSSDPFDTPQPIAAQNSSGAFSINGTSPTAVADGWVYFDTSNGLSRIRADAPPLSWDLAFKDWEVTQGIQNLTNNVPLVANKPTYVRVYGTKLSGPAANNVEALLQGQDANGASLGTLRSINGVQNFLVNNGAPNRAVTNGGWLFQLPDSWTSAGVTRLTIQIDPRGVWNDPNRGNNAVINQAFTFNHKAPVCIVTIPVRTHGPVADNNSPNLFFARDMLKRLWPVSDVWLYHQDDDIAELQARFGIPPWEYGPYEIPDDTGKMITSLTLRDLFSDDPDRCDDVGARTHYVGIVSPQTQTGDDNPDLGTNGSGRVGYDQAWVKLPADGYAADDWKAVRAATLAHELGHNYGREHVNCGGPDDPDGGYPYKDADGQSCTLDNRDQAQPTTYFGFNPVDQTPIKPTDARDLLAYGRNRWISDYTFRGIMNGINNVAERSAAERAARAPQLAAANGAVLVTGVISTTEGQGELNYSWVYPTGALGRTLINKWQTYAAPTMQPGAHPAAASYHLRLLDASGAVLDDRAVTLAESDLHGDTAAHAGQHDVQTFALTFPTPTGQVARMELLQDSTVLASLKPGAGTPTISVLSPAGGETIDNAMTISWRASDPDPGDKLLFSVQYSPDNGQHWRALLSGLPNRTGDDTVTLNLNDLSGIPASTTGGLIRVAASDGYNTAVAVSQPFTVNNRAPEPHIDAPGLAPLPAGQAVVLQGSATDAEDGGLVGASLRWALDGADIGSGQTQTIEGLAPGSYTLTLTARDAAGKEATATQTLTVAPLAIPKAAPTFDGDCNDAAYVGAARLSLAPYADGTQAVVSLVRTDDALYACFSGMKRTAAGSPGTLAVVRVDGDHGRRSVPGANDHVFYTNEAGVSSTFNGNGTGYVAGSGGAGAQISASSTSWNAELRIDASAIGGMNHVIGLGVEQALLNSNSDRYTWPQHDGASDPSSWGAAALGDLPQLSAVAPASAPTGAGDTVVTINGSGFAAGATARLNGVALATTVISGTQLQATIPAANLALAGAFSLTAANPGLEAAPSNALPFSVTNPLPHITQAVLAGNTLTLTGGGFAAGATVQFNGHDYAATGDSAHLRASVSDADQAGTTDASVSVFNSGPGGGVSNVVTLGAAPAPGSIKVYLPLVAHR